ncbi:fasciclin domain-containing protein [Streptomyces spiramenti]|uniref:Fasciclin domain-containing protein n=1 Tax=Streptomyces spiramenti TaxID=2720606 RepID=A0ABX1AE23_9ACTN|nr:fasciclin domain-containing protein [Streptomyces spiramenti]NJP65384.1 fasciclin domain-containing protein [Streptomyces spiramenti]
MNTRIRRTAVAVATAAILPFSLAACSSDSDDDNGSDAAETGQDNGGGTDQDDTDGMDDMDDMDGDDAGETDAVAAPFGPACSGVPTDGPGSFEGMAQDPVATAASNNPDLSTLVAAVTAAGLVDTLNDAPELTVFAPADAAFAEIPEEDLNGLLEDQDALTDVLTYHVVGERLAPEDLDGEHTTLQGDTVTVAGSDEDFTVNDDATVVCGNVQTANATVYIIDGVLMP